MNKLSKKYKHIFFDLDRTLWDFENNSKAAIKNILKELNLTELLETFDQFIEIYTINNDRLWEAYRRGEVKKDQLRVTRFHLTLKHFGINNIELAKTIDKKYLHLSPRSKHLMPNAIEILEYLKKKYNLYIVTNGFKETQHTKMSYSGILDYFDKVISSEDVGYAKPDYRIFHKSLSSVNAKKSESLMIGDDYKVDIEGAKKYGIDQVFYNNKNESINGNATYEIHSLLELKDIL